MENTLLMRTVLLRLRAMTAISPPRMHNGVSLLLTNLRWNEQGGGYSGLDSLRVWSG